MPKITKTVKLVLLIKGISYALMHRLKIPQNVSVILSFYHSVEPLGGKLDLYKNYILKTGNISCYGRDRAL